jgi:hypothetical protein
VRASQIAASPRKASLRGCAWGRLGLPIGALYIVSRLERIEKCIWHMSAAPDF